MTKFILSNYSLRPPLQTFGLTMLSLVYLSTFYIHCVLFVGAIVQYLPAFNNVDDKDLYDDEELWEVSRCVTYTTVVCIDQSVYFTYVYIYNYC